MESKLLAVGITLLGKKKVQLFKEPARLKPRYHMTIDGEHHALGCDRYSAYRAYVRQFQLGE